jgi:hypothetical protein
MLSAAVSHQTTALCIREREKGQIRFIAFVFLNIIMSPRGFVNGIIHFNKARPPHSEHTSAKKR